MHTKLGPFQILEVVGRGGMGTVYRGLDPIIGRPVAVKVIRLVGYNDQEEQGWLKDRLFREARAAGSLCHPGIVTIYQVAEENEVAYIAMEYVDGPSLQEVLLTEASRSKHKLCQVLAEAAAALDYAHRRGLIHRDIKPANIMLTSAGVTKVTDFGIAKTMLGQTATKTGLILGTPFYMSPEQIRGKTLDGRSDQFALAVMAYEIFTGKKPFQAEQLTSVCYQIIHEEPISPEDVKPGLGGDIAAVIKRGLSKDAGSRYATCTEFVRALTDSYQRTCAEQDMQETPLITVVKRNEPSHYRNREIRGAAVALVTGAMLVAGGLSFSNRNAPIIERPQPEAKLSAPAGESTRTLRVMEAAPAPPPRSEESRHATRNVAPAQKPTAPLPQLPAPPSIAMDLRAPDIPAKQPIVRKGLVVWTGLARNGELLTISGSKASNGTLSGTFPGGPIKVEVYPAKLTGDGLMVLTSDSRLANVVTDSATAGKAMFVFDPRHSTDLTLFEGPSEQNNWRRVVIRANTALSVFVIAWQHW